MPNTLRFQNLSPDDRRRIVDQALVLFEDLYVHLPLKQAMHAVRPIQRLKLLRLNLSDMKDDFEFHNELTKIFNSVRDLHMNYLLPSPFSNHIAYLPFQIEAFWEQDQRKYLVAHLIDAFDRDRFNPTFIEGVQILHWSGVPVEKAVANVAEKHAGSNLAARHARGVVGLTMRPLVRSLPPIAEWVDVEYRAVDGIEKHERFKWQLFEIPQEEEDDPEASGGALFKAASVGIDIEEDMLRRASKKLFVPGVEKKERRAKAFPFPRRPRLLARRGDLDWPSLDWPDLDWPEGETIPALEGDSLRRGSVVEGSVESFLPKVFNARVVTTGSGTFAYIRIRTFSVDNAFRFVLEFIRLAALLPQNGLIIDVRDNGGGLIMAGEMLLQTLTPKRIEPEPLQFVNTAETRALIEHHSGSNRPYEDFDLTPWRKSARYATKTGATYTRGFPITSPFLANFLGQRYHGPVVLITNGRCYSTTDIFAAGFQDHEIGQIIGTDGNTGAGGANVWRHSLLRDLFDGVPANGCESRMAVVVAAPMALFRQPAPGRDWG